VPREGQKPYRHHWQLTLQQWRYQHALMALERISINFISNIDIVMTTKIVLITIIESGHTINITG
jgi:hypothetical protein